jgi:hypothetical protein
MMADATGFRTAILEGPMRELLNEVPAGALDSIMIVNLSDVCATTRLIQAMIHGCGPYVDMRDKIYKEDLKAREAMARGFKADDSIFEG